MYIQAKGNALPFQMCETRSALSTQSARNIKKRTFEKKQLYYIKYIYLALKGGLALSIYNLTSIQNF